MIIEFTKMHGLGNDFVLIESSQISDIKDMRHFAVAVSNRRTGVGCDQLIIYSKLQDNNCEMAIYNQDGSSTEACGNGTRCLVKLLGQKDIVISVGQRKLNANLHDDGDVTVNMGKVDFDTEWMSSNSAIWEMAESYKIDPREIMCVSVGNPHIVIFKSDLTEIDKALIGKALEYHDLFPSGVNVNFAKIVNGNIKLVVWERGSGFTLACGSGACASHAAARKLGFIGDSCSVEFALGALEVSLKGDDAICKGPASLVAQGYLDHNFAVACI